MVDIKREATMSAPTTIFAAVRAEKILDLKHLGRIQSHGQRLDPSAKKRVVPERKDRTQAWSVYSPDAPLNLLAAYQRAKEALEAVEYGRAAIGLHLIVVLSAGLIAEAGDPHDPDNPLNKALATEGAAWAERVFGQGSVIGTRLDLDEAGSGELDVIVVPVRMKRMNSRTSKRIISVNSALEEIRSECGDQTGFGALQTSWAQHAKLYIDPRIQRGVPKSETGRRHVHADVFRPAAEEARLARVEAEEEMQARLDIAHAAILAAEEERSTIESAKLAAERLLQDRLEAAAKAKVEALKEFSTLEGRIARAELAEQAVQEKVAASEKLRAALAQKQALIRQDEERLDHLRAILTARTESLRTSEVAAMSRVEAGQRASITATSTAVDAFLDGRIESISAAPGLRGGTMLHFAPEVSNAEQELLIGVLRQTRSSGLIRLLGRVQDLAAQADLSVEDRHSLEPGKSMGG